MHIGFLQIYITVSMVHFLTCMMTKAVPQLQHQGFTSSGATVQQLRTGNR